MSDDRKQIDKLDAAASSDGLKLSLRIHRKGEEAFHGNLPASALPQLVAQLAGAGREAAEARSAEDTKTTLAAWTRSDDVASLRIKHAEVGTKVSGGVGLALVTHEIGPLIVEFPDRLLGQVRAALAKIAALKKRGGHA